MSNRPSISAPTPLRNRLLSSLSGSTDVAGNRNQGLARPLSATVSNTQRSPSKTNLQLHGSLTPDPAGDRSRARGLQHQNEQKEHNLLVEKRLEKYSLDYPEDYDEYSSKAIDPESKWFSREEKRKLNLAKLLPYQTENHEDQAKYLCHVIVHLYIAIKSMDLEGLVSISTKDLMTIKNDIELTLDTDIFNADLRFDFENESDDDFGDEEDDEVKSSGVIGKVLPRSATVISVNHWTNELKTCLKMKFDLPLKLRGSLAKAYYYLTLVQGQDTEPALFCEMFLILTGSYKSLLIKHKYLSLRHEDLLTILNQFYPDPDPDYTDVHPMVGLGKEILTLLAKLASAANPFFEPGSMRTIYDWCFERYSYRTANTTLTILSHTLPIFVDEEVSVLEFIPSIFHIWTNYSVQKLGELQILDLFGRMAAEVYYKISKGDIKDPTPYLKDFGIFTTKQFDFILNSIQVNLRIDQKINSFHSVSKILIYSITPQNFDLYFERLQTLISSIETFVHPSNLGKWTPLVARFLQRFLYRYHRRYLVEHEEEDCFVPEELKLTLEMNSKIIELFKDVIIIGSNSKKETASNYYVASLCYLCDIPSDFKYSVINKILIDLYDSLTDQFINSNHRIIVSLKQFTEVSKFMVDDKVYRVHITNIILLLLSKIGKNDLILTNGIFNALVTVLSLIQVKDLSTEDQFISFESTTSNFIQDHLYFIKENPNSKYEVDEQDLNNAFIASTKSFKLITKNLVDGYIALLDADINDKILFKLSQSALIITQSLSDEIFAYYTELIENLLFGGDLTNEIECESLLANIVASVIKKDPTKSKSFFFKLSKLIKFEVDQGAGQTRNSTTNILGSDKMLTIYLITLSEVLSVSLGESLEYKAEFLELIEYLYFNVSNPSIQVRITYLIHKILKNLTNIKLKENNIFQYEPSADDFDSRWGLNHTDKSRFNEDNLQFDWYVPSSIEISCAVEIFETIVVRSLSKIDELSSAINDTDSDITKRDELIKNFRYLNNALSGASILFDPEFSIEDFDDDFKRNSLQKKLMILKSLRESKGNESEINIDIEKATNSEHDPLLSTPIKEGSVDKDGDLIDVENNQNIDVSENIEIEPQVMVDEDQLSSRVLTPSTPHDSGDLMSVMNSKLAFRESRIYNCNYFFGSTTSMKRKYSDYGHIHSLRSLIGQSLHQLTADLINKEENNVKLIQALLITLRTYFCDVGKESSFDVDDQLFIDYTFLKKVQSIGNHTKTFTRTTLGARIEKFHRQRIILHSTNRFQTKLDKLLLKDIVLLCISSYTPIHLSAQLVMVESIRKLIGSYSYSIDIILDVLEKVIKDNDLEKIESGLRIFRLKKILHKIVHDYKHLKRIVAIVSDCLNFSKTEINDLAQKILADIGNDLQVPSPAVSFNVKEIDAAIRPPDKCIDLEISTVKSAKDSKRLQYFSYLNELQDFVIEKEEKNKHWKSSLIHLKVLQSLQHFMELQTREKAIELLIKKTKTNHPSLVRLSVNSIPKYVHKIVKFASFNHNLEDLITPEFMRKGLEIVDTSEGYVEKFANELSNFNSPPNYFIDSNLYRGFIFWGKELKVLSKDLPQLDFTTQDISNLSTLGKNITSEWLDSILKTVAQENETKGYFQASDVELIKTVVFLIYYGFTTLKYEELLELIVKQYNKNEKESVIICSEIVCGLLNGTKYTSEQNIVKRDEFLKKFLNEVISSDLTPESSSVWSILFWMISAQIDTRRAPMILELATDLSFLDIDSNLAFLQSSRLGFTTTELTSLGPLRFKDYKNILDQIILAHPYTLVRRQTSSLLGTICITSKLNSVNSSDEFLKNQSLGEFGSPPSKFHIGIHEFLINTFEKLETLRIEFKDLPPQQLVKSDYFYMADTMCSFLDVIFKYLPSIYFVPYLKDQFVPFLMKLIFNKELCKLGGLFPDVVMRTISNARYIPEHIPTLLDICLADYSTVHQLQVQLVVIGNFYSKSFLTLNHEQKNLIISKIDALLFHNSFEVRTEASKVLSGIIHNSNGLDMVNPFILKYNKIISKYNTRLPANNEKIIKLHGATVGIGSLIQAFPYVSPPPEWLPKEISILAKSSSINGIVGKAAKDILSAFKKVRADTWHIDRESFNEEQLEDLEGVLWRSYFA